MKSRDELKQPGLDFESRIERETGLPLLDGSGV